MSGSEKNPDYPSEETGKRQNQKSVKEKESLGGKCPSGLFPDHVTGKSGFNSEPEDKSEFRCRFFPDIISDGALILSINGEILYSNRAFTDLTGISDDDLSGINFSEFIAPKDRDIYAGILSRSLNGPSEGKILLSSALCGKNSVPVKLSAFQISGEEEKIYVILSVPKLQNKDGAELKEKEGEVNYSGRIHSIINASDDAIVMTDRDGTVLIANSEMTKRFGISVTDIVGSDLFSLFSAETAEERRKVFDKVIASGKPEWTEDSRNGLFLENRIYPVTGSDGNVEGAVINSRDVTWRKISEDKLKLSEENYRRIFENAHDQIIVHELIPGLHPGRIIEGNRAACETLGYTHDGIKQLSMKDIFVSESGKKLFLVDNELKTKGHSRFSAFEKTKERRKIPVEVISNPINENGSSLSVTVIRNVSEETELLQRLKMAVEGGELGTWDWDVVTGDAVFNDRWYSMLGYTPGDFVPTYKLWESLIHPDDKEKVIRRLNAHLSGETPIYDCELRLRNKKGHWVWIFAKGRVIERDLNGNPLRAVGTQMDVTGRIIAEKKLIENMRLFRGIFDYSFDYLGILSPDGILEQANETALELIGVTHKDVEGKPFPETPWWTHSGEEQEKVSEAVLRASFGKTVRYETTHKSREGRIYDIDFSIKPVFDDSGRVVFLIAEGRDISDLKKTENELRGSNEKLQKILANLPRGMVNIIDSDLRYIFSAGEELSNLGLSDDFLIGKTVHEYPGSDAGKKLADAAVRSINGFETIALETEHDGQVYLVRLTPLEVPDGQIRHVLILSINITQENKAEKRLYAEKELFRSTFESLADAAFVLGKDPVTIILANKAATSVFGYSNEEMIGKTTDFLHVGADSLDKFRSHVYSSLDDDAIIKFEFKMKRKNREVFPTEHIMSPLFDEDGEQTGWVSFVRDITEEMETKERELAAMDQIQHNMMQLAALNDGIRNPLAVIRAVMDLEENIIKSDVINDQIDTVNDIIRKLDEGLLESEKIWNYLRVHYGVNKPEKEI